MNSNISEFRLRFSILGKACFVSNNESHLQRMLGAYSAEREAVVFRNPTEAEQRLKADNYRLIKLESELTQIIAEESHPVRIRQLYAWLMAMCWNDCIEVCFCDHAMMATSGSTLLSSIPRSRIRRVGIGDDLDARGALNSINDGFFDTYLSIGDLNLAEKIQTYSNYGPILQLDCIWRNVAPELTQLLAKPELRAKLGQILEKLGVAEHILLPMPLGLLCRTVGGKGIWIQLEVEDTQIGAVEILRELGFTTVELIPIMQGKKAACLEILPALNVPGESMTTWADITVINAEPWMGMAVFELPKLELV